MASRNPDAAPSFPDSRPLPEIIAFFHRAQLSGTLHVTATVGCRSLLFCEGELRSVRSTVEEEMLGSWLVGSGVISEDRMALGLLAQLDEGDAPLGSVLVRSGHLADRALAQSLEKLTVAIIERATADRRLDIVFQEGNNQAGLETVVIATTSQLILTAARMVGSPKAHRRLLGTLQRPVRLCHSLARIRRELEVTDNEMAVLGAVKRSYFASLDEIKTMVSLSSKELLATAYGLVVAGLLTFHSLAAQHEDSADLRPGAGHRQAPAETNDEVLLNLDRAGILVEIGNTTGAIRLLEDLFEEQRQPQYLLTAARLMVREGEQGALILATLRRVLETNPKLVEGWLELAGYWRRRGVIEREQTALAQVLALEPEHRQARARFQTLGA